MLGAGTVKQRSGTQLTVIEWHPYPQDRPPRSDTYMVTYSGGGINFRHYNRYSDTEGEFTTYHARVIAWAERPQSYEEGEKQ